MILWLALTAEGFAIVGWMFLALIVKVVYALTAFGAVCLVLGKEGRERATKKAVTHGIKMNTKTILIIAASIFGEEALFRAPLILGVLYWGTSINVIYLAGILSLLFGAVHIKGGMLGGWWSILIQGGAGFIYCLLFLKCGGFDHHFIVALATTTTLHIIWDTVPLAILWQKYGEI